MQQVLGILRWHKHVLTSRQNIFPGAFCTTSHAFCTCLYNRLLALPGRISPISPLPICSVPVLRSHIETNVAWEKDSITASNLLQSSTRGGKGGEKEHHATLTLLEYYITINRLFCSQTFFLYLDPVCEFQWCDVDELDEWELLLLCFSWHWILVLCSATQHQRASKFTSVFMDRVRLRRWRPCTRPLSWRKTPNSGAKIQRGEWKRWRKGDIFDRGRAACSVAVVQFYLLLHHAFHWIGHVKRGYLHISMCFTH